MTKTARVGWVLAILGSVIWLCGCSSIFDGQEYLSADAAGADAGDAGDLDAAPPDRCEGRCGGVTPVCEPTARECVGCLADHDCGASAPACETTTRTCVECTATSSAACGGDAPVCDALADGRANTCVSCNENADCPDSAPVCRDDHTCAGCASNDDCASRLGARACDLSSGACVECTALTASTNCPSTRVCTQANTCSAFGRGAQDTCQACDDDDNCMAMYRCVPMTFGEPAVDHGSFCLRLDSATCARPYSRLLDRASLGGQAGPYCGIAEASMTCEAVRALVDDVQCPGGGDSECADGGLCRKVGALPNRCTYECNDVTQCKSPPVSGSTCGNGSTGGVSYCGGG